MRTDLSLVCHYGIILGGGIALASLSGCGGGSSASTSPPAPVASTSPFASVVFLGDSLTSGFQNGSLLDTQQPNGYANLIATQAKFSITLPLIAAPGAPAVLKLVSTGFPPVVAQTDGVTTGRDNPDAQPTDLAVPGHLIHDLINRGPSLIPTSSEDIITTLVLGFPLGNTHTQLGEAIALKPSTIFLWIGNNDALVADSAGTPSVMTSLSSFTSDYTRLMASLKTNTSAHLVVANIPDVTTIPVLTPAALVISEAATQTGLPAATVGAALGIQSGDLVNGSGLKDLESDIKTLQAGGTIAPLADGDVLTAAEVLTVQSTINSYNSVIQQQVAAAGGTLVDMHAYFASLATGVTINGYNATTGFLGGLFGLDGVHPTNTGYALLANQFITATNTAFSLSNAAANVQTIAAADPYFGANVKPSAAIRIPTLAAQRADQVILGGRKR